MLNYIYEILLEQNCVIIPNFGGFIANYKNATIDVAMQQIYPPNKKIAFNIVLQENDGVLANFLSKKLNINYAQTIHFIETETKNAINILAENKSLIVKNIGRLWIDEHQNTQFTPFHTTNFLIETYGLEAVSIQPIRRLSEENADINFAVKTKKEQKLSIHKIENKQESKVGYWVSSVLALSVVFSTLFLNLQKLDFNNQQSASIVNIDTTPKIEVEKIATPTNITTNVNLKITEETKVIEVEKVTEQIPEIKPKHTSKSYIIIGSFFDVKNADKLKLIAEQKGYKVSIANDKTLNRVLIESETAQIDKNLTTVKSSLNARAWVYCLKCNY